MTAGRSIAVAQTVPVRGDVQANVEQHVLLAHAAAAEQARVLVFPELSLTGYELDLADGLAFSQNDPRFAPLVEVAISHAMFLIVGAPVRLADEPRTESATTGAESRLDGGPGSPAIRANPRPHIGAVVISPEGRTTVYTKHYLGAFGESARCDGVVPPAETTVFQPGRSNPLIRFGAHTGAVAVCADTSRASHARSAADRGATAYFASMFVIPSEFDRETATLAARARAHRIAVALANYGGPSGGLAAAGRSSIWSPSGDLLARLGATGIGVAIAVEGPDAWDGRIVKLDARKVPS